MGWKYVRSVFSDCTTLVWWAVVSSIPLVHSNRMQKPYDHRALPLQALHVEESK